MAVAVKLAVSEAGSENESLIAPSTPATRSAVWVQASLLSSSTTTCTVEPGVQFAPLRGPCSPGTYAGLSLESVGCEVEAALNVDGRALAERAGGGRREACRERGRQRERVADRAVDARDQVGCVGPGVALVVVDDDVNGRAGRPVRAAQVTVAPGTYAALVARQRRARRRWRRGWRRRSNREARVCSPRRSCCRDGVRPCDIRQVERVGDRTVGRGHDLSLVRPGIALVVSDDDVDSFAGCPAASGESH